MPQSKFRITRNVHVLGRGNWGGLEPLTDSQSCNVFLLDGGSELALIDVGMAEGADQLLTNVDLAGFDVRKLKKILLTHSHWDHVAALAPLLQKLNVTVYAHALAKETLAGKSGIYLPEYQPPLRVAPAEVHEVVHEADEIRVGDLRVSVVELPGHTPDGLGFTFDTPDGRVGFTGDTAIGNQPTGDGVIGWIAHIWRSKLSDHKTSLEKLTALNLHGIFPGHGNSHIGCDAVLDSLEQCRQRLARLMKFPNLETMFPVEL